MSTLVSTGFGLVVGGYMLAIAGASLLYVNAPRDIPMGRLPVIPDPDPMAFFNQQELDIQRRAKRSRQGFGLLLVGSLLQLGGVILQWVAPA